MAEKEAQTQEKQTQEKAKAEQAPEQEVSREEELTNDLQRLQAEFDNYRKRVERDREHTRKEAKKDILLKLLSVMDNFELALKNAPESEFGKGVELIYAQMLSAMESEGLRAVETKQFDPQYHEALMQEESAENSGAITEVLQKGYTLDGQVIRHAKVKVAK